MSVPSEGDLACPRSFAQWVAQGEMLYQAMMKECHALESQLSDLEGKLAAKQAEVNQLAQIIRKPPVETRRLSAQLVSSYSPDAPPAPLAAPQIARALSGGRPPMIRQPASPKTPT